MISNRFSAVFFLSCAIALSGCSGDNDDPELAAPASIMGNEYLMEIASGTGLLGSSGSYLLRNSEIDDSFESVVVSGDLVDSAGTYTYTAEGLQGLISFTDASLGDGGIALGFETSSTGTFLMTIDSDPESRQSGTFTQQ